MPVTGISPAPRDLILTQVERLVTSDILKGSESLCRLLRYLAEHAIEAPGTPIKEYQIATEVFGRPVDFDPRLDSTVRVQTGRLRSKLTEFYGGPGAEDRIIVELPKGSYSLTMHERPAPVEVEVVRPAAVGLTDKSRRQQRQPATIALWILAVLSLCLLAALMYVVLAKPRAITASQETPPAAFKTFWHGFLQGPEPPWVIFSNAEFVGRPETGMRYWNPDRDGNTPILDHYTGVGEVLAIHELDHLFTVFSHELRVKRGRLLSLDDAKNNDLIFIGSPSENLTLRDMPSPQEFVFRIAESGPRKGDLRIVNLRPKPGEEAQFWGSPTVPISEDHALIGLMPGMNPNRWVMILAGTTTIGTQAAAEFVTREKTVEDLVKRAGTNNGNIRPFEAVIRVKVTSGVPLNTELVALHVRQP